MFLAEWYLIITLIGKNGSVAIESVPMKTEAACVSAMESYHYTNKAGPTNAQSSGSVRYTCVETDADD
jgi:hypothetical protein